MTLPRIQTGETVDISGLPSEFADLFITRIEIHAAPSQPWSLVARFSPYNYDQNVLSPIGGASVLCIEDIMTKAAQYPTTIGVLMGTMVGLLPLLLKEKQLEESLANAPDNTELQAELDSVRAALSGQ